MLWVTHGLSQLAGKNSSARDVHQYIVRGKRLAVTNNPLVWAGVTQVAGRKFRHNASKVNAGRDPRSGLPYSIRKRDCHVLEIEQQSEQAPECGHETKRASTGHSVYKEHDECETDTGHRHH
jgi:hypothetical protein